MAKAATVNCLSIFCVLFFLFRIRVLDEGQTEDQDNNGITSLESKAWGGNPLFKGGKSRHTTPPFRKLNWAEGILGDEAGTDSSTSMPRHPAPSCREMLGLADQQARPAA